ncbi:MAG: flagellar hook assembly protein FlgD [Saprospiraceae bacterium]|jgi:flagellar hook assembly protein FlgD
MTKQLTLILLLLCSMLTFASAQYAVMSAAEEEHKINVMGDPSDGVFFVYYSIPKDAKKVIWTVTDENGNGIIKEKFKNVKAGKNNFQYNYLNGPNGEHTFTITADETFVLTTQVTKKK